MSFDWKIASSLVAAVLLAFAIGYLVSTSDDSAPEMTEERIEDEAYEDPTTVVRYRVPVTDEQPSKGPSDARINIVQFGEFECPFSLRAMPTLRQIMNAYPGEVRVVWRNHPAKSHKNANAAAQVAMEAFAQGGHEKFWELHDLLFQNQQALGQEQLEGYAEQVGLDLQRVKKALVDETHQETIQADQRLAQDFRVDSTPGFFINGRLLRGAHRYHIFEDLIEKELKHTQALLDSGTPKQDLYAELTKNGLTEVASTSLRHYDSGRRAGSKPVYRVKLSADEPVRGPADALVTIVEFADFQCPYSGEVQATLAEVIKKYGNDVRVVWMNSPRPFHDNAEPAALAAMETQRQQGDEGFWAMSEILFANQRELTRQNLERFAEELGLNMAEFDKALTEKNGAETLKTQRALALSLGASGTPTFFINGRKLPGVQPLRVFTEVIEEELVKARDLVQAGTSKSDVYAKIIAEGATEPEKSVLPSALRGLGSHKGSAPRKR